MRCTKLGNKSMIFEYAVKDVDTGEAVATAETVMVYFDYHANASKPLPAEWRQKIADFDGIAPGP
jgi:acyl-CoA thioester hydrolase